MTDEYLAKANKLQTKIKPYVQDILNEKYSDLNEETTKNWFVLPFVEMLGYDIHSSDVKPEVTADFSKKGEKVDYMLQVDNEPVAIIECKKFYEMLEGHINQLYRYFTTLPIHIGILTNGWQYWFFTDSQTENNMDKKPYFEFDMYTATEEDFKKLYEYTRENIRNADIPSIDNKRKQEELERQQREQEKEQAINNYKTQIDSLQSQIEDMETLVEKSKANEAIVEQMNGVIASLKTEIEKTKNDLANAEKEIEELKNKEQEPSNNEQIYNALLIRQALDKENILKENKKLKDEIEQSKKGKKQKKIYKNDLDKQRVPDSIAKDMIDLLPEEVFVPETKVLDPFCRYGELLMAFKDRAMHSQKMIQAFPDEDDRDDYISDNMLYAFVIDEKGLRDVTRIVHKTSNPKESHVVCFGDEEVYKRAMQSSSQVFIKEKLKELGQMKFDIVIGNPPYNNDIYIPFVELGHKLSTDCSVFITPAKWQAKGLHNIRTVEQNISMNNNIVPYMKKIVYYPDCTDIFTIQEADGISYYLIDKKEKHDLKEISTICKLNNNLSSEIEKREIQYSICNVFNKIIDKIKSNDFNQFCPEHFYRNEYSVYTNDSIAIGGKAHKDMGGDRYTYLLSNNGNLMCISKSEIVEKGNEPLVKNSVLTFSSTSKEECENFIKWTELKFTRFMFLTGLLSRNSIGKNFAWRFVPNPGAFDHIFTDEELYAKYGLTDEEINIIESVIKERK